MRQPLQTVPDAREVAELVVEGKAFLEPCAREFEIALVQSDVAERVKDERDSQGVFGLTLQRQRFLAALGRSARLAGRQ